MAFDNVQSLGFGVGRSDLLGRQAFLVCDRLFPKSIADFVHVASTVYFLGITHLTISVRKGVITHNSLCQQKFRCHPSGAHYAAHGDTNIYPLCLRTMAAPKGSP